METPYIVTKKLWRKRSLEENNFGGEDNVTEKL